MNKNLNTRHLYSTYNDWLRTLDFYKKELTILNKELMEIIEEEANYETCIQIERLQKLSNMHQQNIYILEKQITSILNRITKEIAEKLNLTHN